MTNFGNGGFGDGTFGGSTAISATRDLTSNLPGWLGNGKGDGNWNLLKPIGAELAKLDASIGKVQKATRLQEAQTIEQVREIGRMVDVFPKEGEPLEKYRARVTAGYALATCEGTIDDVLKSTGSIFRIPTDSLDYAEPSGGERGTAQINLPGRALDNTQLTDTEAADIIDKLAPAGYRIDVLVKGTFTYITPTDYNNSNHDSTKGYDGLDANGSPKDNGGTYAGLVE